MQQLQIDLQIPFAPKKRTTAREKFITLLMFVEKNYKKRSQWISDSRLEANWKQLQQKHPSNTRELDWLNYFLAILKNESKELSERKTALAHLRCYYQDLCYWATQDFWKKLHNKDLWEWQELFDEATTTFESLEKAQKALKTFQPEVSIQQFVRRMIFFNLSNWRDKKIGRDTRIDRFSLDTYSMEDGQEDKNHFSRQRQVEEAMALNKELQQNKFVLKERQERALALIESAIENIERDLGKYKNAKVGQSNLKLWDLLVLTYGFNLLQTGAAEILKLNHKSINQATISRSLKSFRLKIQLDLIKEFSSEIKEELGDGFNDEEKSIESLMEDWVKNKKNEVEEVLKVGLQERVFNLVVMPEEQRLKQIGQKQQIESLVRKELEAWCDRSLQISINFQILPPKLNAQIEKLVGDFVDKLGVYEN